MAVSGTTLQSLIRRFRDRKLARVLIGATVLALALFTVMLITGFFSASQRVDEGAHQAEQVRARAYLDNLQATMASQIKVQLTWDEAVRAVRAPVREAWTDTYIGNFLWNSFRYDPVLLLDGQGQPLRGWSKGKPLTRQQLQGYRRDVDTLLPAMLAKSRYIGKAASHLDHGAIGWPLDGQRRPLTRWSGAFMRVEGVPSVVVSASIMPDYNLNLLTSEPAYVIAMQRVDPEFLTAMGRALAVSQPQLSLQAPKDPDVNSVPMRDETGAVTGWIGWKSLPLNAQLRTEMRPLLASYLLVVGLFVAGATLIVLMLWRTTRELEASEAQAKHNAAHETMTGLPNRAHFMHRLQLAIEALDVDCGKSGVALAYFDLDRFKMVNDTMGHHVGDELVRQVADRLREYLPHSDLLARIGGDEFVLMRRTGNDPREALQIGSDIAHVLQQPFEIFGKVLNITASCGIARAPVHGNEAGALMRRADIAMYEAKQAGRACARVFTSAMDASLHWRHEVETELRHAIRSGGLSLAYQPVLTAHGNQFVGVEALLRWEHARMGTIGPGAFIPIAEQSGLMFELGNWVMRRVFEDAAGWPELEVAINLSPLQLGEPDFLGEVRRLIRETQVNPARITFEITEGVVLDPSRRVLGVLEKLKGLGFRIALDDFGTGYSSLSYLRSFRFDQIKIDRSFVHNIEDDLNAQSILKAIVALGQSLKMRTVAEGVETLIQRQLVVAAGCQLIQGHFHWPALPPEEIQNMLVHSPAMALRAFEQREFGT